MARTATKRRKRKRTGLVWILVVLCVAVAGWIAYPRVDAASYPLAYTGEIAASANEYGLDPYLVAAVIRTESGFDAEAVSGAGARGLMQLMPETGAWIAEKLAVEGYTEDMLFRPDINIRFGCWYLRFLEERFDGKRDLVAAAYNAGHNRVREWLDDDAIAPQGELTNIPYKETSEYVERVLNAEQKYKKYYPGVFGDGMSS